MTIENVTTSPSKSLISAEGAFELCLKLQVGELQIESVLHFHCWERQMRPEICFYFCPFPFIVLQWIKGIKDDTSVAYSLKS